VIIEAERREASKLFATQHDAQHVRGLPLDAGYGEPTALQFVPHA
jgi:hypothetical protein